MGERVRESRSATENDKSRSQRCEMLRYFCVLSFLLSTLSLSFTLRIREESGTGLRFEIFRRPLSLLVYIDGSALRSADQTV